MMHRLATPFFQPGADFYEIGLMAAASPEFAAAMGQRMVESIADTCAAEAEPHERATPVLRPGVAAV